jgi:zinc D-Ala-D-Ala carboxypeptidase
VLANAPPVVSGGSCQQVHSSMVAPLAAMVAAATQENPSVGSAIMAISCFRSLERQADLYCERPRIAQRGYGGQARWIAPPGYSEHATGLSIDFGSRREEQCNLRPCFANTAVGRWLAINAPRFGFELSFPTGNQQGVSYEPWHYRYIGDSQARNTFERAAILSLSEPATAR